MSILDSFMISIYGIIVVMSVLVILSIIVNVQSLVFKLINNKKLDKERPVKTYKVDTIDSSENTKINSGELKLINVDEKTAALIMAIISDESKIPLTELQFKLIRAV